MEDYNTLSGAIADLRAKGYTEDFNLMQNCLECREGQFRIGHHQRVDGEAEILVG